MRTLLLCLTIIACSLNEAAAQARRDYHSELVKIDSSRVVLAYQDSEFILGQDVPTVIIQDVYYHKQARKYLVYGLMDDVNYNGNDNYQIRIDILKGDKVDYTVTTSSNGAFAFSMAEGERARFTGELYIDLAIR